MTTVDRQTRLAGTSYLSCGGNGASVCLILRGGKPEVPWLELGRVKCGARKMALFNVANTLSEPQVLTVEQVPHEDGIHVFGAGESSTFTVQPGCTHTLRIQWVPSDTGSMRCVLPLKWSGFQTLQVVVSGTAMAGSTATVTTKSHGEVSMVGGIEHKACNSALPGNDSAGSSSDWSIPAARAGAEPPAKKLPALSRRGGLKPGAKLDLLGANVRKHDVPADERSGSSQWSRDTRAQAGPSSRITPHSAASPTKSQSGGQATLKSAGVNRSASHAAPSARAAMGKEVPEHSSAKSSAAGSPGRPAAKPAPVHETVSPRKRPGLRASERSVEGVMNAPRPAAPPGKLRLHPQTAHPSAGVRMEPAGRASSSENPRLPGAAAGKAATAVRPTRPKAAAGAWPETDVSTRKTFSFVHKGLWLEKQEKAFGVWLNAALAPPPPGGPEGAEGGGLAAARLEARVRGALWHLYCGDSDIIHIMTRIEKRIDEGFLRLKPEEAKMGDMRTKAQVAEVLSAYHPFWLRLGLEVVVGKAVPKGATSRADLEAFARDHFLGDADLALQRAGNRAIVGLHSADYWVELGQLVLKRFLLLALLLDRAVAGPKPCPKGAPLLFCRGQPTKSSSQAVEKFLRGRMHGEGDVMRHLASLGLRLGYEQDPRTEFDFAVGSLAVDLRSGVRLLRLTELLKGEAGLVQSCHFPAERRAHRLANVQRALAALAAADAPSMRPHAPEPLVDGDRDATLGFLATLFLHLQLPAVLDYRALAGEIARIQAISSSGHGSGRGLASHPVWPTPTTKPKGAAEAATQLLDLLLRWARAICGRSGVAVRELSPAYFSDGSALCYMVNFYMPWLLPAARICHVPDSSVPAAADEEDDSHFQRPPWVAVLDEGEQAGPRRAATHRNFELLAAATARLGCVPPMLTAEDCCAPGGPHEHAVIGYVAFLCGRLLEVSSEERAAHTIQRHWRMSRTRSAGGARAHLHAWIEAARDIQAAWRARRFRIRLAAGPARRAALLAGIAFVRGWRDRRWILNHITIPAILQRCLEARQALISLRVNAYMGRHAIRVQAFRRGAVQRRAFLSQRAAAVQLQAAWRASVARRSLSAARAAALAVQRAWRGFVARSHFQRMRRICTTIQSAWRCFSQRTRYTAYRSSVVAVQSVVRRHAARQRFIALRHGVIVAQKLWRGRSARQQLCRQTYAAVMIQACWRRHLQRQQYLRLRSAAICIQAHQRRSKALLYFKKVQWAIAMIQKHHRGCSVRRAVARQQAAATCIQMKAAAVCIQRYWRGAQARARLAALRAAAVAIQAHWRAARQAEWRGMQVRQSVNRQRTAALTVQKHWRAARLRRLFRADVARIVLAQAASRRWAARKRFLCIRAAAITVQSAWRGRCARLQARQILAAITLQKRTRGWLVRRHITGQRSAAVSIQSAWRRTLAVRRYRGDLDRIVACQALARQWLAVRRYCRMRRACVTIQAAIILQRHARGWRGRRMLARQRRAAVRIQSVWRGVLARWEVRAELAGIVACQSAARRWLAVHRYGQIRRACVTIQAGWRGRQARRLAKRIRAGKDSDPLLFIP
ncbi:probable abnormal spindle-like microcephaly-associated protein homolog [Coccomyxa sp. Obi]|nr:probable abnormal spindle-like microcephaly-associated protein homolog [Coccomyxa sp. Obi]